MGRNGKKTPVFGQVMHFINSHVGETVTSFELLLGNTPDRGAATSYLYKFIKLGYIRIVEGTSVLDPNARYEILRAMPPGYNSQKMKQEMKLLNESDLL